MSLTRKRLGSTGLTVSRLALGTMTFGLQTDEATSHALSASSTRRWAAPASTSSTPPTPACRWPRWPRPRSRWTRRWSAQLDELTAE